MKLSFFYVEINKNKKWHCVEKIKGKFIKFRDFICFGFAKLNPCREIENKMSHKLMLIKNTTESRWS